MYRKVVETGGYSENEAGNRTVIPAGEVKFIGYYAIPRKTLFTPKNTLIDNPAIIEVTQEDPKDIFKMAVKGYIFRWDQLRRGILEEGEGLALANLDYAQQLDIYALEPDYDKKDLKARAYGDKNITLKGGLE